jgi:hypothetical protein
MKELWKTIREIVALVESENHEPEENEKRVLFLLDKIAFLIHEAKPEEEYEGDEIPETDYMTLRKEVEGRFPNWGYYNSAKDVTQNIAETSITVGDAIDDLTDIVSDLKAVLWCLDNENENNALWQLQDSYSGHWREHMFNLRLYAHCLRIGV